MVCPRTFKGGPCTNKETCDSLSLQGSHDLLHEYDVRGTGTAVNTKGKKLHGTTDDVSITSENSCYCGVEGVDVNSGDGVGTSAQTLYQPPKCEREASGPLSFDEGEHGAGTTPVYCHEMPCKKQTKVPEDTACLEGSLTSGRCDALADESSTGNTVKQMRFYPSQAPTCKDLITKIQTDPEWKSHATCKSVEKVTALESQKNGMDPHTVSSLLKITAHKGTSMLTQSCYPPSDSLDSDPAILTVSTYLCPSINIPFSRVWVYLNCHTAYNGETNITQGNTNRSNVCEGKLKLDPPLDTEKAPFAADDMGSDLLTPDNRSEHPHTIGYLSFYVTTTTTLEFREWDFSTSDEKCDPHCHYNPTSE